MWLLVCGMNISFHMIRIVLIVFIVTVTTHHWLLLLWTLIRWFTAKPVQAVCLSASINEKLKGWDNVFWRPQKTEWK